MYHDKKILVADDEEEITRSLRNALSQLYIVDVAHSASEVIEAVEKVKYHAIILDVCFQHGISGLEVAEIIRENDREVRLIIMSAMDYTNNVKNIAVNIGANFLEKTISIESLKNMLQD